VRAGGSRALRHLRPKRAAPLRRGETQAGERLELIKVSATQAGLLEEESNVGIVYVLTRDTEDLKPSLGGPARISGSSIKPRCASGLLLEGVLAKFVT
jgi:hypothetical protein